MSAGNLSEICRKSESPQLEKIEYKIYHIKINILVPFTE